MSRHITEIIHEGGSRSTRAPLGDWVLTRSGDHLNRIDKRQIDQQACRHSNGLLFFVAYWGETCPISIFNTPLPFPIQDSK